MSDLRIENQGVPSVARKFSLEQKAGESFGRVIEKAIDRVDGLEKEANTSVMNLLSGNAEMHETMIALQKADISMRLMLSVRNKAIEAYKEIMHMQF